MLLTHLRFSHASHDALNLPSSPLSTLLSRPLSFPSSLRLLLISRNSIPLSTCTHALSPLLPYPHLPRTSLPDGHILVRQEIDLLTEEGEQGRMPVTIMSLLVPEHSNAQQEQVEGHGRRAAVIILHSTGKSKEALLEKQKELACLNLIAITCDLRYHGACASSPAAYSDALVRDVWDVLRLMDYLTAVHTDTIDPSRIGITGTDTIDPSRIGITGVSLGGARSFLFLSYGASQIESSLLRRDCLAPAAPTPMIGVQMGMVAWLAAAADPWIAVAAPMIGVQVSMVAWLAAAADPRIAAAAPMIGVQCFRWAVDNNCFHARVASIPHVFNAAAEDMGKAHVDAEVVTAVWNRITPGLLQWFGPHNSLPAICPRPLLILNGETDPRCPVEGLKGAVQGAEEAYSRAGVSDHFESHVEQGVGHEVTEAMWHKAIAWMQRHLVAQ
ncbi:unnamed protein product [Closterium sp. NIES-65]|nr:unnamed protein product [Closterium sp. NIES-65]